MEPERIQRADLLSSLAVAIDIGLGIPMNTMLRTTLIAVRLARAGGHSETDVAAAYYLGILRFVGCSTTSHETSLVIGDELALGDLLVADDHEAMPELTRVLSAGRSAAEAQSILQDTFAAIAGGMFLDNHRQHCEAGRLIAARLGLGPRVEEGLLHAYERWDGQSFQRLADGEAISLPMRVAQVALQASYDSQGFGTDDIARRLRARAGRQLDPRLAELLASDPGHFLADLEGADLHAMALAAEPGGPVWLSGEAIDTALSAIADFGDLKSPHMLGHSRRVARVAEAAATAASLPAADVAEVRRAALIHDIGRVGVQSRLLSKTGALSRSEHERIRLHSYLTGRVFSESPVLGPLGALGSAHHERLDGSGYHRGLAAPAIPATARLLAAANAWCALTEPRPHRQRLTDAEAARNLSGQIVAGLLDRHAVDAVLTATGQKGARTRRAASVALSDREVEVLRHLARQLTNPAIATALGISPKTVERHVTHIYDKTGVTTRAGATLWALENGLL